jgi:hypothetical protein
MPYHAGKTLSAGGAIISVKQRSMTVYHPDGAARELGPEAELDGGAMLPGFRARVGDLFEVRRRR